MRCGGSLADQGLRLIRDISYPAGVADFCGSGVGEGVGLAIFPPRPAVPPAVSGAGRWPPTSRRSARMR